MKGFDLYRIAMAYLGVIFVLCALVVFKPLRWIGPQAEQVGVQESPAPVSVVPAAPRAPTAAPVPSTAWVDVPPSDAADIASTDLAAPVPVDEAAEQVARQVAEAQRALTEDEIGEGDASGSLDFLNSPEVAMVARGLDVTYTVAKGDSLGALALRFYGDSALAGVIFEANKGLMRAPDRLRVGQVLIIPGRS